MPCSPVNRKTPGWSERRQSDFAQLEAGQTVVVGSKRHLPISSAARHEGLELTEAALSDLRSIRPTPLQVWGEKEESALYRHALGKVFPAPRRAKPVSLSPRPVSRLPDCGGGEHVVLFRVRKKTLQVVACPTRCNGLSAPFAEGFVVGIVLKYMESESSFTGMAGAGLRNERSQYELDFCETTPDRIPANPEPGIILR